MYVVLTLQPRKLTLTRNKYNKDLNDVDWFVMAYIYNMNTSLFSSCLLSFIHWFQTIYYSYFSGIFDSLLMSTTKSTWVQKENTQVKFSWFLSLEKKNSRLANATAAKNQLWPYLFEWVQVNGFQETEKPILLLLTRIIYRFRSKKKKRRKNEFLLYLPLFWHHIIGKSTKRREKKNTEITMYWRYINCVDGWWNGW